MENTFYVPNTELDSLMLQSIQMLRFHLLELEKVRKTGFHSSFVLSFIYERHDNSFKNMVIWLLFSLQEVGARASNETQFLSLFRDPYPDFSLVLEFLSKLKLAAKINNRGELFAG